MAIQLRRGAYANFDPTKMVPGEIAVVQSGDTGTESGKSVYMAFNTGDVERLATHEEMESELESLLVNRVYVGTCSTSASTAEKTVNCDGFVLENNALIYISFAQENTVTSGVKFNVNNTGAKDAYFRNSSPAFEGNTAMAFSYNSNSSRYEIMQDKYVYTIDGLKLTGNFALRNLQYRRKYTDKNGFQYRLRFVISRKFYHRKIQRDKHSCDSETES